MVFIIFSKKYLSFSYGLILNLVFLLRCEYNLPSANVTYRFSSFPAISYTPVTFFMAMVSAFISLYSNGFPMANAPSLTATSSGPLQSQFENTATKTSSLGR